jgi:DNA helicase II / ATP-dependent DNA helicase PcrA
MNLNVEQNNLVTAKPQGISLIKGVAGSGKTTVALYRTLHLLRNHCIHPDDCVLLVSYNKSFVNYLKYSLDKIAKDNKDLYINLFSGNNDQIVVTNVDKLIHNYYTTNINNGDLKILHNQNVTKNLLKNCLKTVSKEYQDLKIFEPDNLQFLFDEINWMKTCRYLSLQEYQEVDRTGRMKKQIDSAPQRIAKNSKVRQMIHVLMKSFDDRLSELGYMYYHDLAIAVLEHAQNNPPRAYNHIIIDESQDLTRVQLEFLKTLYRDEPGSSLTFLADNSQSIYNHAWLVKNRSFKDIGFDMIGKSSTLNKNYRTSTQVAKAAYSLINKDIEISECENFVQPYLLDRQGHYPVLAKHETEQKEASFVCHEIKRLIAKGFRYQDITIIARNWDQLEYVKLKMDEAGVPGKIVRNKDIKFAQPNVKLLTMHSIKGLEYRVVFIIGLNDGVIPYPLQGTHDNHSIHESNERKLLYVGMTRAKELLYLSCSKEPSKFIADMNTDFIKLKEESKIRPFYHILPDNYINKNKVQHINGKEEKIRQWITNEIIETYRYPKTMITFEKQLRLGSKKCYADICITAYNNPYILIETKAPGENIAEAIEQLKSYLGSSLTSKYGIVTDGNHFLVYKRSYDELDLVDDIPIFHESMRRGFSHNFIYHDFRSKMSYPIKIDFENPGQVTVYDRNSKEDYFGAEAKKIPVFQRVAAGTPLVMDEIPEEYLTLPVEWVRGKDVVILEVKGNSMIGANIDDGDHVVVEKCNVAKNRDIVIAFHGDEAIIKRYSPMGDTVLLLSENEEFEAIHIKNEETRIFGVTLGVIKGKNK